MSDDICGSLRNLLQEYALGERAEISAEERDLIETHLAWCQSCREGLAESRRFVQALAEGSSEAPLLDYEEVIAELPVPQAVFERCRSRTMLAVREELQSKCGAPAEGSLAEQPDSRQDGLFRFALSSAAAACLGFVTGWFFFSSSSSPSVPEEVRSPVPVLAQKPDVAGDEVAAQDLGPAERIRAAFRGAREDKEPLRAEGNYNSVLALCEEFIAVHADSPDIHDVRLVAHGCQVQLGNRDAARSAYMDYVDGRREEAYQDALQSGKDEKTAAAVADTVARTAYSQKAHTLMAKRDHLEAIAYCDILMTRHPGSREAIGAHKLLGDYYLASSQPEEALREYRKVVAQSDDRRLVNATYEKLSRAAFNHGRREEAIEILDEYQAKVSSVQLKAKAGFLAGFYLCGDGEESLPDAVQRFRGVMNAYPDTSYAVRSEKMIALVRTRMLNRVELP